MENLIKKQDDLVSSVLKVCLHIPFWRDYPDTYEHTWFSVKFDSLNKEDVPQSPGLYAFFIKPDIANLFDNSSLIYIGKAGDDSENTLQKRFMQYLYRLKRIKRPKLNRVLNKWKDYLYFYFSEINDRDDLGALEDELLDAFVPYCNETFSAKIRDIVKVLR